MKLATPPQFSFEAALMSRRLASIGIFDRALLNACERTSRMGVESNSPTVEVLGHSHKTDGRNRPLWKGPSAGGHCMFP